LWCARTWGSGQLLIYQDCGEVTELGDIRIYKLIETKSRKLGFEIAEQIIEVEGLCAGCQHKRS